MMIRAAADAVLLLHLAFVLFAVCGAALAFRWRWMPYLHLPAVAWAVFVELTSRVCPLTTIEIALRRQAGEAGYSGSFIEHYLIPLLYPPGLTPATQYVLAGVVTAINLLLYAWLMIRRGRTSRLSGSRP
jgi:hypothetical protein